MAASYFEFKYRFWIFGGLFCLAFAAYNIDHQNSGAALAEWIARLRAMAANAALYRAVFTVAALFCLVAALVRTWATAYLNPEVMSDTQLHSSRLVADGPYRYVRNPLYFGNILLAIGFGLMASRIGLVLLVVGMIVFDYRLILREEAELTASQGASFRDYCAAVPRLLPAVRPRVPAGAGQANWRGGLLGEAFMWVLALSVVAFTVTLNLNIYSAVVASAFAVYGICLAIIRRQKNAVQASSSGKLS